MSDCGVCVYADYDGNNEFFSERIQKAAKPYRCCECGKTIPVGQRYTYACGKFDGDFRSVRTCLICDEIADAFCCDGRIFGQLWAGMHEVMGALTTACFERLKTPEAKADLRVRWMRWKGLTA